MAIEPWHGPEWQRLWLSVQARPWTALAVVPGSSGAAPDFTVRVALTLARTGLIHLSTPVHVADATDLKLADVAAFTEDIQRCREVGDRIVLALGPLSENPVTESLAQLADYCLLCVLFENMAWGDARRTVAKIGKERFLGTTIFRPEDLPPAPAKKK